MTLEAAIYDAQRRRELYHMDVHVLKTEDDDDYFTVLSINLDVFLKSPYQPDKKIYYTAWKLKK